MPLKPRKKSVRQKKSTRTSRSVRRPISTPLSREVRAGAAALGVLVVVVLLTMIAARPHAGTPDAATEAHAATVAASESLIAEETAPPKPAEPSAPPETEAAPATAPVTITGCLERSDETFRLKDTEGEEAPRTRSWKSGFLKKSAASVQLVDAANRAKLPAHVGQRVSVTGTLIDRELRVRSLRPVAASCGGSKTKV